MRGMRERTGRRGEREEERDIRKVKLVIGK